MKYSTVEIKPSRVKRGSWQVMFSDLDGDRVKEAHAPHGLGFYHYPRRMGKEKAFEILRSHLVKKHEEEICKLVNSLASLCNLQMPK